MTAADWNAAAALGAFASGAILQWNLTGLNPGDSMGAVGNATITLGNGVSSLGNTYTVYRLTGAITGSTTWNAKPSLDTSTFVSVTGGNYPALQTINVSSLLVNNGSLQTFGLAILVNSINSGGGSTGDVNFLSTAFGNGFPYGGAQNNLSADYSVVPEPSTYAMLMVGIGLLLVIRRRRMA